MEQPRTPNGQLVLVVDDQPFFTTFLHDKFTQLGYGVVGVRDGGEALAFVRQVGPPLVIVLDLMMPRVSGEELLLELARSEHARGIRVVLVSSSHAVEAVAEGSPMVVGRLQKPLDFGEVARLVRRAATDLAGTAGPGLLH
jgi:two-component system, sensor histidine kinase ChiS